MHPIHYPDSERCKKLTKIGFPETELVFSDWEEDDYGNRYQTGDIILRGRGVPEPKPYFVCPSVMEMLDVIPHIKGYFFETTKYSGHENHYTAQYTTYDEGLDHIPFTEGTLPNALADLIFWLVENGYLKLPL